MGICVCEGIIITLPAKSFGGGGFCDCKLRKLAGLRLLHGQDRIMFIMLNLLCNDNNALAFYAYLWLYHSCVLGAS